MLTVTAEQMEWVRHCHQLGRERLRKPVMLTDAQVARLRWLVETEAAAITAMERKLELVGAARVVGEYMVRYADLHLALYARKIGDAEFYRRSAESRAQLEAELRRERMAGNPRRGRRWRRKRRRPRMPPAYAQCISKRSRWGKMRTKGITRHHRLEKRWS